MTGVALAPFYAHLKAGHVEAGLRRDDKWTLFPEEMNRRMFMDAQWWYCDTTQRVAKQVERCLDEPDVSG